MDTIRQQTAKRIKHVTVVKRAKGNAMAVWNSTTLAKLAIVCYCG